MNLKEGEVKLSEKQRTYLNKLRDAIKAEVSVVEKSAGNESGKETHLRNTVRFLNRIIESESYYKQSAVSIEMAIDEFHKLIKKHG